MLNNRSTHIISLKSKDRIILHDIILDDINIGETVNISQGDEDCVNITNITGTVTKVEHFIDSLLNSTNYNHKCIIYVY